MPRRQSERSETVSAGARTAEVVLDVDVEHGRVHLVLANCGNAVAADVTVEFSRPIAGPDGAGDLAALPLFKRLGVLRPGRTLRIFWGFAPALLGRRDQTAPFVATVSWNERSGARQHAEYHHDVSVYRQFPECVET